MFSVAKSLLYVICVYYKYINGGFALSPGWMYIIIIIIIIIIIKAGGGNSS